MTAQTIYLATTWIIPVLVAITFHEAAHGLAAHLLGDDPRRDMVLVAAAGPAMNIALAVVAALLFHLVGYLPPTVAPWVTENLKNGLIINVVLAVFNLFPIPPLDGGRILVGILPKAMAAPVARLEPYGIAILLGVLIVLPLLGAQLGVDLNIVSRVIRVVTGAILEGILRLTGNV